MIHSPCERLYCFDSNVDSNGGDFVGRLLTVHDMNGPPSGAECPSATCGDTAAWY